MHFKKVSPLISLTFTVYVLERKMTLKVDDNLDYLEFERPRNDGIFMLAFTNYYYLFILTHYNMIRGF